MRPAVALLLLVVFPATAAAGAADLLAPLKATQVKVVAAGGGEVVTFEAEGEPEALWSRLRAAREADGWRLVRRFPALAGRVSATLERRGRRLIVVLARGNARASGLLQTVTPPTRQPRLRGPCVAVPERRFEIWVHPNAGAPVEGYHGRGRAPQSIRWGFHTGFDHDLDGDGLLDALVPLTRKAYCPQSVRQEIYITRCSASGCCGHKVGSIGGGHIDAAVLRKSRPGPAGLKPIVVSFQRTEGKSRIPERYSHTLRYAFDGRGYRVAHRRRSGGRCHHCGFSTCTGPIKVRDCPLALPERPSFAAIHAGMEQAHKLARACYKRPLLTAAGRPVSVKVETAGKSGEVVKVELYKHESVPARLEACIRQALRQVRFGRFCEATAGFSGPLVAPRRKSGTR
jgi:hypothetical protein